MSVCFTSFAPTCSCVVMPGNTAMLCGCSVIPDVLQTVSTIGPLTIRSPHGLSTSRSYVAVSSGLNQKPGSSEMMLSVSLAGPLCHLNVRSVPAVTTVASKCTSAPCRTLPPGCWLVNDGTTQRFAAAVLLSMVHAAPNTLTQ